MAIASSAYYYKRIEQIIANVLHGSCVFIGVMTRSILAAIIFIGIISTAYPQDSSGTLTVKLKIDGRAYLKSRPADGGSTILQLTTGKPSVVLREPKYEKKAFYASFKLGYAQNPEYLIALDPVVGSPSLYFDANQNGDLTDDPPIEMKKVASSFKGYRYESEFLEIYPHLVKDEWSHYGIRFRYTDESTVLEIVSGAALTGMLSIDGRPSLVKVIDEEYLPKPTRLSAWERLGNQHYAVNEFFIDLNGDGIYELSGESKEVFRYAEPEVTLLNRKYAGQLSDDKRSLILKRQ